MGDVIRVNFTKPMPVFPLPNAVVLPHAIQPLHVFEPRYRQMVADALGEQGTRLIAMATFDIALLKCGFEELRAIRPAVCVGRIIEHEALGGGRSNILVQGICRARIDDLLEADAQRLYNLVRVHPLEAVDQEPVPMPGVRSDLCTLLTKTCLQRLRYVPSVVKWFNRDDVSTHALLELVGFTLFQDNDLKYELLAEASPDRRACLIRDELDHLRRIIDGADGQSHREWPKGLSWN
ncbi:MAG: LON peptidase substrate-binding domain-containing protein [Phycisphaerales bacterium]|nr:LON peptidase substrate-binding domain-containing protein [Phycisphaerales bacterium]